MKKQKKVFSVSVCLLVSLFLFLVLFFPQNNLLADDDPCANGDCKDSCPSDKPYSVHSKICEDVGLVCCSATDDPIVISNPNNNSCELTSSEGSNEGFLTFKGSVVPCGRNCDDPNTETNETETCTFCHFILMANNIYNLLFALVIVVSILTITIGGTIYLVSSGNRRLAETGKDLIVKTLWGFALFLAGEMIIFTVLKFVGVNAGFIGNGSSWYEFTCDTESGFGSSTSNANTGSGSGSGSGGGTSVNSKCSKGTGNCSEESLQRTCLKDYAEKFSYICQKESSGSLTTESQTDRCKDNSFYSFGLFQINLAAHADKIGYKASEIYEVNSVPGTLHNSTLMGQCLKWVESEAGGYCALRDCKVKDKEKYESAKGELFEKDTNIRIACQISNNGSNTSPWSYTVKECGL